MTVLKLERKALPASQGNLFHKVIEYKTSVKQSRERCNKACLSVEFLSTRTDTFPPQIDRVSYKAKAGFNTNRSVSGNAVKVAFTSALSRLTNGSNTRS